MKTAYLPQAWRHIAPGPATVQCNIFHRHSRNWMRRFADAVKPKHQRKKKTRQNSNTPNLVRRYRRHVLPQPFLMHNRNLNRITKKPTNRTANRFRSRNEIQKLRCSGWRGNKCNNRQTTSWAPDIPITSDATNDWKNLQIPGQWGRRQAANCQIERTGHKGMGGCVQRGIEEHGAEGTKGDGGMGGT